MKPPALQMSPQLQEFMAAPESTNVPQASFSTHGIWGPGVRWMRNMSFVTKAILISVLFAVPLGWVSYSYYSLQLDAIAFSAKERLGVEYAKEVYPLLDAAQGWRREAVGGGNTAAGNSADAKAKMVAALQKVAEVDKRFGADFATTEAVAAVKAAFEAADKATGAEQFRAHTEHIAAIMALVGKVADGSNLSLDPDIDSYYVMDAVFFRIPDVVENTAQLRGIGLRGMKDGVFTPEMSRALVEKGAIVAFQFGNMSDSLAKSAAANPASATSVDAKVVLADILAFTQMARASLSDGREFTDENRAKFLEAGNKAVVEQYDLAKRILVVLDGLLEKRIDRMKSQLYVASVVLFVGVFFAVYFFYCFFLVTRGGLRLISRHLQEMAEGDLRKAPYRPWGKDEPAMVIQDLRRTYDSLHALIRKVRHSARALHAASGEISAASNDLAARTESAAASLEEQASAMEEIGVTVGGTAERAQSAAVFAKDNAHVAEQGGKVFGEVVTTMREIHTSSSQIGDIIGVIDGIAFQTNILALNAAVEAARAGEQGRGFAVVATEVRTLAQRSAAAAREIKTLINASVERVEGGTRVVEEAGKAMSEVVTNAKKINGFLDEISMSSRQQATGVAEVGRAIQDLDRNTQQNAALVEQTSASAGALAQQADLLQDEIANFRVA